MIFFKLQKGPNIKQILRLPGLCLSVFGISDVYDVTYVDHIVNTPLYSQRHLS